MSFVYPWFLLGLLAISIPVLIHLFHFRRFKKVYFSSTKFLEKITDETEKQSKIKHLLVLLARILAITCLVLAFAKPYIPTTDSIISYEGNSVAIYIDNSFSMEDESISGTMLDLAIEKAKEIAEAYSYSDEFLLLTNDFEGRHQRFVGRDEFISMLEEIRVSPFVKTLSEVASRQMELLNSSVYANRVAYIISDFQENICDFDQFSQLDGYTLSLLPLQSRQIDNLYIDSIWLETPIRLYNQNVELFVRIRNTSNNDFENQPVRLFVDYAQRGVATFNISARSYANTSFTFIVDNKDFIEGYVEITDYPITFDNTYFFSFSVTSGINVLSIYKDRPVRYINALFGGDTLFNFSQMSYKTIDYSVFARQGLIVLNGLDYLPQGVTVELKRYVESGGSVIVFPSMEMELSSYEGFLKNMELDYYTRLDTNNTKVSSINEHHIIYQNVFDEIPENISLPIVRNYFTKTNYHNVRKENILIMQNGMSFLSSYPYNLGTVFLSSVGLSDNFSNFHRHSIFAPTLFNIALQSNGVAPIYHIIGSEKPVLLKQYSVLPNEILTIKGENIEFIPQLRDINNILHLYPYGQVNKAGNYDVSKADELIKKIAFNYDRRESETFFLTSSELKSEIENNNIENVYIIDTKNIPVNNYLKQMQDGIMLWALFLLLALGFLLAEIFLLRFLK